MPRDMGTGPAFAIVSYIGLAYHDLGRSRARRTRAGSRRKRPKPLRVFAHAGDDP